jgi:sodium/bile acid cotransporter 7
MCDGLLVLGCLPTSISMCFLLTKSCGGNEAIALFNATFGNLFGVFYTPMMILMLFGTQTGVDPVSALEEIGATVFFPLVIGQIMQRLVGEARLKPLIPWLGLFSKWILLILAFSVFCDTFSQPHSNMPVGSLAALVPLVISCYAFFFLTARFVFAYHRFGFRRGDQIAAWFSATHKTLALGIPIIQVCWAVLRRVRFYCA